MSEYLDSFNADLDESQFFRMFAFGCFDSFITLPISITSLVANIARTGPSFVFYKGWTYNHSDWEPVLYPKSMWSTKKWSVFSLYWGEWINPFLALVFFVLFGLTPEARKGYRRLFRFLGRPFGLMQGGRTEDELPDVVFKSGRGTSADVASNVSSRYVSCILFACKHFLI